ncbi:hypothetical protein GCM10010363_61250 [Streptomyces omiyaensis]|uniref:hypothetical protein n=1 Tax=Streptomyces omiyaensis TaxID=68247 RepID=UPI00167ABB67|nr:hypothetical protein [Streptomyces omiyaensis]GGY71602.1 hypothetical protein GCM10010363_61250 [Streptomyces omiyaensis]
MGERFSTPEDVREHWRDGGDAYRVSETKSETDQRRASARYRASRTLDAELVGEALLVARVERSTIPTPDQYLWGVFHAGTALPVVMMESGQVAEQARELARAIDAWRDPESGQPFDWTSDGLSDRLRSPYGRGMLDRARGREPGQRWEEPPPAETEEWETDDGQTYTYGRVDRELRVFAPGGLLIARAASRFDVSTKKDAWIGETRDGRRLAGRWERHFVEHAVQQHLIAQREPADRDDLWIHYTADRAMVHGSDRYDTDLKKVMRSAGFTWSGHAQAYVTASTTRAVARAQSVDRLARALYEEGRAVEIRADEDRLRGILAPAASGPAAVAAATGPASPSAPGPEPTPALEPKDLTDELLAAELTRLTRERDAAVIGGIRRRRLDEQLAPLVEENRRRIVASYAARPDPSGMTEEELTAEREELAESLRGDYGNHPVKVARQERADLLAAENGRRLAADLEARPPVLQMTDDDLRAEGEILAKGRYDVPAGAARDAFDVRREAVGVEIADRHLRTWEPAQVPVGELDDIELTEAIETLRRERLYDSAFAGHHASKQRVVQAHEARLHVLRTEQKKRDATAFETLLKTDGRIRLESRSYNAGASEGDVRVFIDGRRYGDLVEGYPGWKGMVVLGRGAQHEALWRTEALSWLIEQYEASPETRDTRTWGPVVDVELPPSLVEHLTTRDSEYTATDAAEKYLLERMADSPRSQSWDETGKKVMVHALDLPERTLPVLERMSRRLVAQLDEELDSDDRKVKERAKRARPNVLRGLDDIRETMQARGLTPLTDAAAPQDGETNGERVRADSPPALDHVPAPGAGADAGPGGVLRGAGDGGAGTDRGADAGADGRSDAGDGPRPAGGEAEGRAADGEGAGPAGDRAGGAGGGEPGRGAAPVAVRFRPASQDDLAPAGERAKAHANLAAVRTLKQVQAEERPATPEEQQILARWSGWGSVPDVFAARPQQDDPVFGPGGEREGGYAAAAARWEALSDVRDPLRELLDDAEWRAAAASTLSAHYTPPEVTAALWRALADLGFDGGEVLEPGSGAGVTFGTAPDAARLTGVEIDPTSAAISRLLAPGVTVLNESFADTIAPDGSFDAVVGNVPFARLTLFDPTHNKGRHRIHNHFLVKSVALTRPGGVVALITSRHTMDAERDAARRELFENADLLGAVRLPNKAFARSAGTDVVTDILILRRRADGETPGDASWLTSTRCDVGGNTLPVNDYFTAHPEHVLGTLTSRMGAHGPEVAVDGDPDVSMALNTALRQITDRAVLDRRWYQPHPDGPHRPPLRLRPAATMTDFTGRLSRDADGKLWQASSNGDPVAIDLPDAEHAQLAALIELKDLVRGLNDLDRRGTDTGLADAQRRTTKAAYQAYVAEYGALTRPRQQQNATVRAEDGTESSRLTGYGYFLNDPSAYEVLALEWWEADTETVHVSQVLDRAPATRRSVLGQHTDDPQQALTAVVAERGHVDLDHIAWMLQVEPVEARRLLGRSVFTDPLTGDLVHSPDYLSGDVRAKLAIARQAARRDRAYETNVAELERVQPRDLLPGQFAIRLGAAWIPDDMVQDFFRGYLGDPHLTIQHSGGGNWHILAGRGLAEEDKIRHGAGGLSALAMVAKVLNGGAMTGRPADDEEAARAVRVKADEFRDAFEAWALDDSLRAARIAEIYNQRMNARAVRDFTGSAPSLAGLDPDFTPYDHQLASAARMAHERCLVLAHVVSAGKTATMTIGMMAMRNSGQINKPMVTVPNYLVEQWEDTVRKLFPTARILALTSEDLADGKRDRMLEYIRSNDFDLIITSHSLFDSIPLSPEFHELYNNDEARLLREQITRERKRDGKSISLKQLEERGKQFEEELKARAAAVRTPGQVYLDDLGIDFFAVDEFHEYKNLAVRSKIPGARVKGSGKSQHVHEALEWARMNKPTGPIGVLATGTPLSNAIGELHTLVRMANPDLLREIDAEPFDAWASMYGTTVERMEMTTDGKGFKAVERFASFHNVPAMVRQLWYPLVDYKSAEDLGLKLPSVKGGEPELMLVPATADQLQRMQELGERYETFRRGGVDKSVDNPLAINNDARVIAMDSRLTDADAEPGNKLVALADRIIAKHEETKDNRYTYSATDQRPHPVPGALQFVFLNNGTPGGKNRGNFNAYQELKDLLVARGMPAEKIAFIHDAERADQRIKLQHNANHGGINVLIGSTMRMGKGLNAQNRAVALYHVDPDWRPSDMAQRDGRIVRNGNQNPEVEVVWMATEGTFDSRMYGLLATKAKGFDQLYKARLDGTADEIMEVDDANLPYEEAMAIISGNPYLIEQEELRKQLRTLELDQRNRATQRAIIGKRLRELHRDIENLSYDIPRRARVLPLLEPVLGDDFRITLAGTEYTKHKNAAKPLMQLLAGVGQSLPAGRTTAPDAKLGRLGGLDLVAVAYREDDGTVFVRLHLDGLPGIVQRSTLAELADLKGETVLRRLVKTITEAPERQTEDEGNLAAKRTTRDQLLIDRERLRGQVQGLGRARERKSLVDSLVAAQAALNKIGKPSKDEPADLTTSRHEATARRDELQQRLDRLAAEPAPESSSEAGAILRDMDDAGPRPDPASYTPVQAEAEAALLRAHLAVHGHDAEVAARLAALGDTTELPLPAAASLTGPQPAPERPQTPLEDLIAGFGDRVAVGHIGGPQTAAEAASRTSEAPTDEPTEEPIPDPENRAEEPAPAPPPAEDPGQADSAPALDDDPYGTANLFDEFGLPRPDRVPVPAPPDSPSPDEPQEEAVGVPEGQMRMDDAAPAEPAADEQYERLTSADGQLTFTLARVPTETVEGYQRRYEELVAAVENRNAQTSQSREERDQEQAKWQRGYKASNGLEPWRPAPALRLTRRTDTPGLTPQEYALGSWVTWQDTATGTQVTGQVMAPGASKDTWFVSTDRTVVTGEYHVLWRDGKKSTGYSYSINGDTADLRPAAGPPEPVPFESLPAVDAIPARPVASYADHVPKEGMAMVREPVPVFVGPDEDRGTEVVFPVTADHIPFVVKVGQHAASGTPLYALRVEVDGQTIAELGKEETRAAAVDEAVRVARRASEFAAKPLHVRGRDRRLDVAEDGICARCNRQFDGDTEEQKLYRVDGGEATCSTHIAVSLDVTVAEVQGLGIARRIWAARTAPEPQSDSTPAPAEEPPSPEPDPDVPRLVDRATIGPGDLVTVTLDVPGVVAIGDLEVPGAVRVTGYLHPAFRAYHSGAVLLDSVIHDAEGNEVATGADVTVRLLPSRIELTPAGHRPDLRPEIRTAGQLRLGDFIAEGGTRGEVVTEIRYAHTTRPASGFSSRDVATGTANQFSLANNFEVLVVPRERRRPQDVAEVFGRHHGAADVAAQTRQTHERHIALEQEAARLWPDGDGPQDELRALRRAVAAIEPEASAREAYRANAAATAAAAAAATVLFDAVDDTIRYRGLGEPLHRLRQHLDVQMHRLHADVAYLTERAAAEPAANPSTADEPTPPQEGESHRLRNTDVHLDEHATARTKTVTAPQAATELVVGLSANELEQAAEVYEPERKLAALRAIEEGVVRWSFRTGLYSMGKDAEASPRDVDWACGHGLAVHVEYGRGYRVELTTLGHGWLVALAERVSDTQGTVERSQPADLPAAPQLREAVEQGAQDQPVERTQDGGGAASQGTGEMEQLGLFGDPVQGPAEPEKAAGSGASSADEPLAQSVTTRGGGEAQLQAALIEGETIAAVSFTDLREPAAGWILTTAGGHTFRLRPVPSVGPDEDQWEAGHDADGSYWWAANLEDRPLTAVLARIREDSATRTRFASLWSRYGHLTEQATPFQTTTDRVQLEEGVYLVRRFGRVGLIASCRWGWEHLTDPDGGQGHTGEDWARKGPDNRQYVAEWQVWHSAQEAIPNARLRVVAQLTDDMADTPDAYCDASAPYVGKCSSKRSGARYRVAVDTEQGSELGHYTVCARCLSHRLLSNEDRRIGHRDVQSLVQALAQGDPKVVDLHWRQWSDRIAELAGQMLSAALDAGETAPWPAQALTSRILAEACEAGDDRAMRQTRAEVKAAGGNAKAQKKAADKAFAARRDRAALVARRGAPRTEAANEVERVAVAILGLAGWGAEGSGAAPEPAEETPVVVDVNTLTVSPLYLDGEPSSYQFTVTGPGLTVGTYEISHDAQGKGARGIMWRASWHGVEPSGRWDVIGIGSGKGKNAALAAVAEHAAKAGGDLTAGFAVARRMHYDAGLWLLPDVGESEAIEYHPDGSWTITAETGVPYTVRWEWQGHTASGDLAPLLIEDQSGALIASCTAVDGYMSAWAPILDRLRLHASSVADRVPHATAVTLGGPGRDWVEAWCVCGWTERTETATYADRVPAGEALVQAHHSQTPTTDAAPQPLAVVVTPSLDDAAQTEAAEAPSAAELPELDVVLLDVDVPPLDPAEPYSTDEEAQADIDRLSEAFARWDELPMVQRYYDTDRQQRFGGRGAPTNPVAHLAAAYQEAAQSLRDGPAGSPDDLVRQVHTVAVWSGALETVVGENLRGPLSAVREAATLLASRSQATVKTFEAELAALTANSAEQDAVGLESPAAEPEPAEQAPVDVDDETEVPASSTEPGPGAPAADTDAEPAAAATDGVTDDGPAPEPEETPEPPAAVDDASEHKVAVPGEDTQATTSPEPVATPDPTPAPEQAVRAPDTEAGAEQQGTEPATPAGPGEPQSGEGALPQTSPEEASASDASVDSFDVQDPPEPRPYTEVSKLPADAGFELRLFGMDGQGPNRGELLHAGTTVAVVRPSASGRWFARLAGDGLPADVTALSDSPQEAAHQGAILFAALTQTPYGPRPAAATASGPVSWGDRIRLDLRNVAESHLVTITRAAARVRADYTQIPQFRELQRRLTETARAYADAHSSGRMISNLASLQEAVVAWRAALPQDAAADERQHLAYPLAHLQYDVQGQAERLRLTLEAAQAERAAAQERTAAPKAPAEPVPDSGVQTAPQAPAARPTAPKDSEMATPPRTERPVPGQNAPAEGRREITSVTPLPQYAQHTVHLRGDTVAGFTTGELRRDDVVIATVHRTTGGLWFARMDTLEIPDITTLVDTPEQAALHGVVMHAVLTGTPLGDPVTAAPGAEGRAPGQQVQDEAQAFADRHARAIETAVRQVTPNFLANPHYLQLAASLAAVADAEGRGPRQMTEDLRAVEEAVNAWGNDLPLTAYSPLRSNMAFPLAELLYETRRLQARVEATRQAVQAADTAAAAAAAAAQQSSEKTATAPAAPAPAAVDYAQGPGLVIGLRRDGAGVKASFSGIRGNSDYPLAGIVAADVPRQALDSSVDVPVPIRPAELADRLVSSEETEAWLAAHLPGGALAPAWESPKVRAALVEAVRDDWRDALTPWAGEVADWLKATVADHDHLIRMAHEAADLAEFQGRFAQAADSLVKDSGDELRQWAYQRQRDRVLNMAAPGVYRVLRDLPLPAGTEAPGQEAATVQAPQPAAAPLWGTDELPVSGYAEEAVLPDGAPAVPQAFVDAVAALLEAWDEQVPDGVTAAELREEVRPDLAALQAFVTEAAGEAPAVAPAGPQPVQVRDENREAAAVTKALQDADSHGDALQELPEWRQIQSVRRAMGHLLTVIKERAGEHFDRLLGDRRAAGFLKEVSVRVCEGIARVAQRAADKLRGDGPRRAGTGERRGAEALLRLGDAASAYSAPRGGRGTPPPAEAGVGRERQLDVPALQRMGEALARPMPGRVSAAAARGRSTTVRRPTAKPAAPGTEQAGHLRRGGPDQHQQRKPQR